jgi:TetR/AcrR family transcriptional repressor of nem operon
MHKKEDIIRKGSELFRKQGYHNTGISDILKACDIPKGSFYNYFNSKEDFIIKVLDYYGDSQLDFIKHKLKEKDSSPLVRLKRYYQSLIDIISKEDVKSGCLVNNISNEMGGLNEHLAEAANRNFMKWIDIIARMVAKGQAVNEIRNDMGALEIAEYLHGSFYGMLSRMKVTRNIENLNDWYTMTFKFISVEDN